MLPASFDESNCVIDKPESMTRDECGALSAWQGTVDGIPVLISYWKLTAEELEEVKRTGRVWLWVWGHSMPPVSMTGESPFVRK